jgi:hypothetical protein
MHIPWDGIDAVATNIAVGLSPIANIVWRRLRQRAIRRNAEGRCAACNLKWGEIGVAPVEFQFQGSRICAPCAHRLRRRTVVEFAGLAVATAFASGAAYIGIMTGFRWTPWWGLVWLATPPIALAVATSLVVRQMRAQNRARPFGPALLPRARCMRAIRPLSRIQDVTARASIATGSHPSHLRESSRRNASGPNAARLRRAIL